MREVEVEVEIALVEVCSEVLVIVSLVAVKLQRGCELRLFASGDYWSLDPGTLCLKVIVRVL